MNNKNIIIVASLFFILASATFVLAQSKNQLINFEAKNEIAISTVHYVGLHADHAEPKEILVKVGDLVQFDSKDGKTHNIASGKGNDYGKAHEHMGVVGIESGEFGADEGYRVQFKEVGSFFFHDHLSPNITVSVIVYDSTKK